MGPPRRAFAFSGGVPDQLSLSSVIPNFPDAVGANEGDIQEGSGYTTLEDPADSGIKWYVTSFVQQRLHCTCSVLDDTLSGVGGSSSVEILTVPSKLW